MVRINSRAKGARFERWLASWFRNEGFSDSAKRGQQHAGVDAKTGEPCADVVVPGITDWLHIEAKAVERLNVQEAMDQSRRDCEATDKIPCVIHKRNHAPAMVTLLLDDFAGFLRGDLPPDNI